VGDATWGEQDERQSVATIHAALDAGVNFFDTAESYGAGYSEALLGRVLASRRHEVIIATKTSGGHLASDALREACEGSLKRLRTDVIDLYQIHWPNHEIPIAETLGALDALKQQGKIRAAGVSNFGVRDLSDLLNAGSCETDQLPYSLLWRAIEFEIQPKCMDSEIGILCYCPLAQGLLTGKFASADDVPEGRARSRLFSDKRAQTRHHQPGCETELFAALGRIRSISEGVGRPMAHVALAWLLHQPGVTSVPAGARTPEQIAKNAEAAALKLPAEVVGALNAATEEIKRKMGTNADMWQSDSRFR
jgi:myo-inositol catabolism protein IolS